MRTFGLSSSWSLHSLFAAFSRLSFFYLLFSSNSSQRKPLFTTDSNSKFLGSYFSIHSHTPLLLNTRTHTCSNSYFLLLFLISPSSHKILWPHRFSISTEALSYFSVVVDCVDLIHHDYFPLKTFTKLHFN